MRIKTLSLTPPYRYPPVPSLQWGRSTQQRSSPMIEFPLILIGYALVPIVALLLMTMADRPQETGDQQSFPYVEIL